MTFLNFEIDALWENKQSKSKVNGEVSDRSTCYKAYAGKLLIGGSAKFAAGID